MGTLITYIESTEGSALVLFLVPLSLPLCTTHTARVICRGTLYHGNSGAGEERDGQQEVPNTAVFGASCF